MTVASSAREPGPPRAHVVVRCVSARVTPLELTSRAEESDEANEFEVVVGGMILGVTFGAILIGAITFATWALGLARYTRAW